MFPCIERLFYSPFHPNVQPNNEESRLKLVEEIKNRAKQCISTRNFPEAVALYSKGIELTSSDAPAQAILYANRSMCNLNMSKGADSLRDAEEAVKLDPSYIKGYYRLAMAHGLLNQHTEAKDALVRGLTMKPDDKELQAQLIKVEDKLSSSSSVQSAGPSKFIAATIPRAATTVSTKSGASTNNTSKAPSSSSSSSSSMKTSSDKEVVDDDEDLKNLNVRGYKKTSDGKTTTFFNNEMDEETKKLIGNIAPKKLDANGEVITTNAPASGSAWNSAGTYEEKILTSWATEYLRENFSRLSMSLRGQEVHGIVNNAFPGIATILIEVSSVEEVTGDAQVTLLRGKKKHVCDYTVSLKWNILVTFSEISKAPINLNGTIQVLDITADREYEVDQVVVTQYNDVAHTFHSLPKDVALIVNKYVKDSDLGLQKQISRVLNAFWDELKSK